MDEKTLSASLGEFGLSRYEARAYVALISRGTISAGELSYYSEVPRTKIYHILLKLEKKRLAVVSKSKPIMCTPVAPEDAFDAAVREQADRMDSMNSLVAGLKKVSDASKKSRGAEEKRYFHMAASGLASRLKTMVEGTKNSMHVMADKHGLKLLAECREQLLLVLRRGAKVHVIISPDQVGSELHKSLPEGVKIRASDVIQNCLVFDETELLLVDSSGAGAVFPSAKMLGSGQLELFKHVWNNAVKTDGLSDMTIDEAQEIHQIIRLVDKNALGYVLDSNMISKNRFDLLEVLEKGGIKLENRTLDDIIDIVDSSLQITCSGRASLDAKAGNVSIESKSNSGHSLPWVAILDGYLKRSGYSTRMTYQSRAQKGEHVHLKFIAQGS